MEAPKKNEESPDSLGLKGPLLSPSEVAFLRQIVSADDVINADSTDPAAKPLQEREASTEMVQGLQGAEQELYEEATTGKFKIKVAVPLDLVKAAVSSPHENRAKLAGSLAARMLEKYPQLTSATTIDPVALWSEIRDLILDTFETEVVRGETAEMPAASA